MHCCTPKCSIITVVIGSILCIGSGLLLFYLPDLISSIVTSETELNTESVAYDMWENIPVKIQRKFYVFDYINWEEFVTSNGTIKPIVEQRGPYVYLETRNKVFLDWDSEGEYVRYRERHRFNFAPELSNGTEDDFVWTPNVPFTSSCDKVKDDHATLVLLNALNEGSDNPQKAFVNVSVSDLLFYGYHDPLLEAAQSATNEELLPGSYYAMFYGKNTTDDGHYEINRGYNDIKDIYKIHMWNESETINLWSMDRPDGNTSRCNQLGVTDGSFYWPGIERSDRVSIFISDVCRTIFMDYVEDMEFKGIEGYRYASNLGLFADPNMNPDNDCYCSPDPSACIAAGVTALGPCKFEAPIFVSHAHFLYTDYDVKNAIDGLSPEEDKHRLVVNVEPNSGNLIMIDVRFQINVNMRRYDEVEAFNNIPDTILLPLIWVDEHSELDDERVDLLHDSLFLPMNAVYGVTYALISLTGFIICVGVACAYNLMFRFKKYAAHESLRPTHDPYSSHTRKHSQSET